MSLSPGDTDETVYGEAIPGSTHRYRYSKSAFPQPLPTLPMSKEVAFAYMCDCMQTDLPMRVCDARVATFLSRLQAIAVLTNTFRANPLPVEAWRTAPDVTLRSMQWSGKQREFLDAVAERINVRDSSDMAGGLSRWMHITGGPGTGKTEAIIHAAYAVADLEYAIEIDPTHLRAHRLLLALMCDEGRWQTALQLAEKAEELGPGDAWTGLKRAEVLLKLDRPEDAQVAIDELIERPNVSSLLASQAGRLRGRIELDKATPDYEQTVDLFTEAIRKATPLAASRSENVRSVAQLSLIHI